MSVNSFFHNELTNQNWQDFVKDGVVAESEFIPFCHAFELKKTVLPIIELDNSLGSSVSVSVVPTIICKVTQAANQEIFRSIQENGIISAQKLALANYTHVPSSDKIPPTFVHLNLLFLDQYVDNELREMTQCQIRGVYSLCLERPGQYISEISELPHDTLEKRVQASILFIINFEKLDDKKFVKVIKKISFSGECVYNGAIKEDAIVKVLVPESLVHLAKSFFKEKISSVPFVKRKLPVGTDFKVFNVPDYIGSIREYLKTKELGKHILFHVVRLFADGEKS